jgi:hypothetical protein
LGFQYADKLWRGVRLKDLEQFTVVNVFSHYFLL